MRLAGVLAFLLASGSAAEAHEWYGKRRDPIYNMTTCCGGSDCAPLPPGSMTVTPDGLRVVLSLEQARLINPRRVEPFDALIPFERIQNSEDGQPHICLMEKDRAAMGDMRQGFYCIFLQPST
jgi:hypothetical protein